MNAGRLLRLGVRIRVLARILFAKSSIAFALWMFRTCAVGRCARFVGPRPSGQNGSRGGRGLFRGRPHRAEVEHFLLRKGTGTRT
jgi:hypothetical protein